MGKLRLTWGNNVKSRREQLDMSLRALEKASGINRSHISRIEHAQVGTSDSAKQRLAEALRMDVQKLFPFPDQSIKQRG